MDAAELQQRAYKFALAFIAFYRRLPKSPEAQVPGVECLRSSTSEWSNYRATRRARSKAEFIAKLGHVVEEADESVGWLELMRDANIACDEALLAEAQELCAIFTASLNTARGGRR
jgi:four helix bundle protein